jgi:hypothetical protein
MSIIDHWTNPVRNEIIDRSFSRNVLALDTHQSQLRLLTDTTNVLHINIGHFFSFRHEGLQAVPATEAFAIEICQGNTHILHHGLVLITAANDKETCEIDLRERCENGPPRYSTLYVTLTYGRTEESLLL